MATIMIVEDDRQTNDAVSEYLKSFGHRMLSAYDGDEALQLFECSSIDLIILDIMIPQKTGLAVLHTIRQKSSVPILMLTADEYGTCSMSHNVLAVPLGASFFLLWCISSMAMSLPGSSALTSGAIWLTAPIPLE